MTFFSKTRNYFLPVVLCAVGVAPLAMGAQDDGTNGPPKVLVIHREFLKPGKDGLQHEKTEGAFIAGLKAHHGDVHYFAMTSLTGPDRALFFSGYNSFATWEHENQMMGKNAELRSSMDATNAEDGDLLSSRDQSMWLRRDDLSLNHTDLRGARYMQVSQYIVRPGHTREWEEAMKMTMGAYTKGVPEAHWTAFAMRYGGSGNPAGNVYLIVTPVKSGEEMDRMAGSSKAFREAMGEDGLKRRDELMSSAVESLQMNLFEINPRMSNPPESWVKAEPEFWSSKE